MEPWISVRKKMGVCVIVVNPIEVEKKLLFRKDKRSRKSGDLCLNFSSNFYAPAKLFLFLYQFSLLELNFLKELSPLAEQMNCRRIFFLEFLTVYWSSHAWVELIISQNGKNSIPSLYICINFSLFIFVTCFPSLANSHSNEYAHI